MIPTMQPRPRHVSDREDREARGWVPWPRGSSLSPRGRDATQKTFLRRAITLLVLSLVVPGSAQFVCGNRRVGRIAVAMWVALVGCLAVLALVALGWREAVVGLLVRPRVLFLLRGLLLLAALVWVGLILDAWRLGRPRRLQGGHQRIVAGLVAASMAITAGPLLLGAQYVSMQRDVVTSVFAKGDVVTAGGRMNVLLLGGDAGQDRVGLRPDSLTVVSIDTSTGDAAMISLPRNLQHARFPAGSPMAAKFPTGFDDLLNATYTYGAAHPELFPDQTDPGAEATRQAVEGTLGIPVHYHVLVDLRGFSQLVDALGGITVRVGNRVPIGGEGHPITGWIEPGLQHLNGYHALWYARSREGSSDYARMARQRCVLGAIAKQADPMTVLTRFRQIAGSTKQIVRTDVPQQALPGLVNLAMRAKADDLRSVQLVPPLINTSNPDFNRIHELAEAALAPSSRAKASHSAPATSTSARADTPQNNNPSTSGTIAAPALDAPRSASGELLNGGQRSVAPERVSAVCSYS